MTTIELHDQYGRLSVAAIDPAAVQAMTEDQQAKLSVLVDAITAREAAEARINAANKAYGIAVVEQQAALDAHVYANPAPSELDAQRRSFNSYNPL